MRSAHNATNTVQPAHLASPTRTRAAKTSPSCHVVWAHSRKARTRRKAWAGSSGVHRPASRPPAPSRVSRCAAIIERNCPRVEGSQRKPHPVAIAIGLSMWDHTTGGRSHADVLMSGPPLLVLGTMLMRHDRDRSRGPEYVVALRALAHSRRTREAVTVT